jgi:hypothetical protein
MYIIVIISSGIIRDYLKFMMQLGLVRAASSEYEKFFKEWKQGRRMTTKGFEFLIISMMYKVFLK